jgi:exodeoxyribonuclease-3
MTFRLLSYNLRFGGSGRASAIAEVLEAADADVVVLQEASDPHVVMLLAEAAGYPEWGSRRGCSTAFLSRLHVRSHDWHAAPEARHPFLEVVLDDGDCHLFGLHLTPWFSNRSERRRARELRALLRAIRSHERGFHLVAGDFNTLAPGERLQAERMPAWIRAMVWMNGRDIARETIQLMLDEGYVDAWRHLHPDDAGYTFPTWDAHARLDYVFVPAPDARRVTRCDVLREPAVVRRASDHLPVLVEIAG